MDQQKALLGPACPPRVLYPKQAGLLLCSDNLLLPEVISAPPSVEQSFDSPDAGFIF